MSAFNRRNSYSLTLMVNLFALLLTAFSTQMLALPASITKEIQYTLLTPAGTLARSLPEYQLKRWHREIALTQVAPERKAVLHLWLGEYELGNNREAKKARTHFDRALVLATKGSLVSGLARVDRAMALFYEGDFTQAERAFTNLTRLKIVERGVDRQSCLQWLRHVQAWAGQHRYHAQQGIREPLKLDPYCGVMALSSCLKAQRCDLSRKQLLKICPISGRGSSDKNLVAAAQTLGFRALKLKTNEQGLIALPKPLIAYVEHDRFVTVLHADQNGIEYTCCDCGSQHLTWKQWRLLEANPCITVTRPGTTEDVWLMDILEKRQVTRLSRLQKRCLLTNNKPSHAIPPALLKSILITRYGGNAAYCGAPADGPGSNGNNHGKPSDSDPVNLATGAEEHAPPPDLTVYNPKGPSVVWSRTYNSLFNPAFKVCPHPLDYGVGWSHSYNVFVNDYNITSYPVLQRRAVGTLGVTGNDVCDPNLTWDIQLQGATVATSARRNGWQVTFDEGAGVFRVAVPANASIDTSYMVRDSGRRSAGFAVLASYVMTQGSTSSPQAPNGHDAPTAGLAWELKYGNETVATSVNPKDWRASFDSAKLLFQVAAPILSKTGSGYSLRAMVISGRGKRYYSMRFTLLSSLIAPGAGTKQLIYPDGSRISFSAPTVPTAQNPRISCTPEPGTPLMIEWDYVPYSNQGRYMITFPNRTRWYTTAGAYVYQSSLTAPSLNYCLARMEDRLGNGINFDYLLIGIPYGLTQEDIPSRRTPLLTRISDDQNQPLLQIERVTGGLNSGAISAIHDRYGRSVYYTETTYNNISVPQPWPQQTMQLTSVSQIVPRGTVNAPFRYRLEYDLFTNLEGAEKVPLLMRVITPSPTGNGTSLFEIHYDPTNVAVASVVDANGNIHSYTNLDNAHTKVTTTDPTGNVVYSYTVGFNVYQTQTSLTDGTNNTLVWQANFGDPHDPFHPSTTQDGNGNVTSYAYDSFGNLLSKTSPRGVTTTLTWNYALFPLGELISIQEGSRTPTSFNYYEPSGLLKSVATPRPGTSGSGEVVFRSYTYDNLGNVLTLTEPGNSLTPSMTTTFNYLQDGDYAQEARIGQPLALIDNLGHTTHIRYDARGNAVAMSDALGNRTDVTYNIADQKTSVVSPPVGDISALVSVTRSKLAYNANKQLYEGTLTLTNTSNQALSGRFMVVLTNLSPKVSLANATTTYLAQPALIANVNALAVGGTTTLVVNFSAPSDTSVLYSTQVYTEKTGRVTQRLYYTYPGGDLTASDLLDEQGSVFRQVQYLLGPAGELLGVSGSAEPVQYLYDANYRLIAVKDGNGSTTRYSFNPAGYLSQIIYPMGDRIRFTKYDANGNMLQRVDGRGLVTDYLYADAESQLTNVKYRDSTDFPNASAGNVTLSYDGYGRQTGTQNGVGTLKWAYDDNNMLQSTQTGYAGLPNQTISYLFNEDGTRSAMVTPAGNFSYSYDGARRLKSLSNPFMQSFQWGYLDNDWLTSQTRSNGTQTLYTNNARGQMNALTHYKQDGTLLADFSGMTYDAASNRLNQIANMPSLPTTYSGVTQYAYDFKNQLIRETSTRAGGYDNLSKFDPAGNPTLFKGASLTYNKNNQHADAGFGYDGNGNPTTYRGAGMVFDQENRLLSVGNLSSNTYRADGLRATNTSGGVTKYFLYDGIQPICELDAQGNVQSVATFGGGGLLAVNTSSQKLTPVFDPQGNLCQFLDEGGGVVSASVFDATGKEYTASNGTAYGYGAQHGYYRDASTNLYFTALRCFDPVAGRFITRDPIGVLGGINIYSYVRNSPIRQIDPSGLSGFGDWMKDVVKDYATEKTISESFSTLGEAAPNALPILNSAEKAIQPIQIVTEQLDNVRRGDKEGVIKTAYKQTGGVLGGAAASLAGPEAVPAGSALGSGLGGTAYDVQKFFKDGGDLTKVIHDFVLQFPPWKGIKLTEKAFDEIFSPK